MSFTATYLEKISASNSVSGNYYGSSVALSADGNTMAAAVSYVSSSSNQSNGAVRILTKSAGVWSQSASIIVPDNSNDDYLDYALALSYDGATLVVGVLSADDTFADQGKVYVYKLSGGNWSLFQTLSNPGPGLDDNFGVSVAVSGAGSVIVVGATKGNKTASIVDSGAVYTYSYDGSTYAYGQKLVGSDSSTDDLFGASVTVSHDGNYIAVGSIGEYTGSNPQGTVYVYYRSSDLWSQQQKITAAQAAAGNYFGYSVSMSADGATLAVGSSSADDNNTANLSSISIFKRTGTTWAIEGNLLKSASGSTAEYFGQSLSTSFDGDTVLVGAWEGDTSNSSESGAAYVFRRASGTWSQAQRIVSSDAGLSAYFGYSVALASTVSAMVVAAPYSSDTPSSNAGNIYSYSISLTDADAYSPIVVPNKTITVVSKTLTSISIAWTEAVDNISYQTALQYEVRYSLFSNISTIANFESNGTIAMAYASDVGSYTITDLYPGRGYYINVAVKDQAGNKTLYTSLFATAQADTTAPVPGNSGALSVSNVGLSSVKIDWAKATDNYSAAADIDYAVYYSTSNNISTVADAIANGTRVLNFTADISTYTVTNLVPGTQYYFNVLAQDEFNVKAAYVSATATTLADTSAPSVGVLSAVSTGVSSINVSWTAATDNYSSSANILYALYYSMSNNLSTIADIETNGTLLSDYANSPRFYSLTGLVPDTTYYFNVIAKDEYDNKAAYSSANVKTQADTTAPVPGNSGVLSTVAVSETQIDVSWTAAADNYSNSSNVTYAVYRSTSNNISTVADMEANGTKIMDYTASVTSYSATSLNFNTEYYFNVLVKDQYGNKAAYASSSESTLGDSSAPVPGNSGSVTAVAASEKVINISWSAASDNLALASLLEYAVYLSTSNNISTVADMEANGTKIMDYIADATSWAAGSLLEETTYYFNVIVRDTAGNKAAYSAASATTQADTTAPVLGSPTSISVSNLADISLTLSWNKSTDNYDSQSALAYKIYRASSNVLTSVNQTESNGVLVGTGINIGSFNVTGLTPATSYYFNVIVVDSSGNKSLYTSVNATTATDAQAPTPGASGAITTSGITVSSINVSWAAASDNITSSANLQYALYRSTSNNISTVADMEANGTKIMDYTANTTNYSASGLAAAVTYYFNVIVKDATGNKAAYVTANAITQADLTPPTPGSSGTISVSYVTKSSLVLSWTKAVDNYTAQSGLRYEVRRSATNNIGTVSTFRNGTIVKAFTNDISTVSVEGLMPNTQYYFNVLVMDTFGNRAVYSMTNATTLVDAEGPTPGASGAITFSGTTLQETLVSWTRASDQATYFEDLEYALYYSTSSNIGTVANAEANGTLIMDYELDVASFPMTDLTPGTTYYFNVIVRDEQGNKSAYSMANITTIADTTAPVPGNSGTILPDSATTNSVHIAWTKAVDNITAEEDVLYSVYRSMSDNITTVNQAETNGTRIMNWTANVADLSVTGLTASYTYYFNVIAKDEAGNKVAYTPAKVSTITDTSVPSPGGSGVLGASLITPSTVTISWTKGTDNVTDAGFLMYGVYYSTSNNLSTVANIEANGTLAKPFARDIAVQTVTGLYSDEGYYFNVVVRDSAGNKSCYSTVYAATLEDIEAPVPGGSGTITASYVQLTSLILSWNKATDNASVPPNLQYQVRMSMSDNISTVATAEANGTIVGAYSHLTYASITGLNSGDTYYFNVIVKDAKGNKSIYVTKQQKTKNDVVEVPSVPIAVNQAVVVESSTDKIKTLPQVSTHPTLSKPRNWAKVHIIYKSTTTAKRVVVSITDFSQMVGTFKAKNAEIFAVHKVIVEDANNNFVTVPASFIMNADNWNIDVD